MALQHPQIAALFQHYIDVLAPWYDLNDPRRTFGVVVPQLALHNPILFKAIIAFSATHLSRLSDATNSIAVNFHTSCVEELLATLQEDDGIDREECLTATCLLRSYEILNGASLWIVKQIFD